MSTKEERAARIGLILPDGSISAIDRRTLSGNFLNDPDALIVVLKPSGGLKRVRVTRRKTDKSAELFLTINKSTGVSDGD